jgi:hypothetical protein
MDEPRPCKRCGMTIVFIENEASGKRIPAQAIRTVYELGTDGKLHKLDKPQIQRYVSHFETCPKAGEFRRKKQ